MNTINFRSLCTIVLLIGCVSFARANTIITDKGPGAVATSTNNNTLGFDFTVGSAPIELTALGLWDENLDGFTNPHSIGVWDNSGNLLAKAFISLGTVDPLSGEFRYAMLLTPGGSALGSLTLAAGTTYVLGASYIEADFDRFVTNFTGGDQATFDPAVAPGNYRYVLGGGFAFPDGNFGFGSAVGPNAQFTLATAVPEFGPGMLLVALVFAGLLYLHQRIGIDV